jgi:restriction system protein
LPTGAQLCWPTLEAIKDLGGSATVQEIMDKVTEREGFTEEQQTVMRADGVTTEIYHRLAAARTYLQAAGAIERSARGVWAITERGREMTEQDMQGITAIYQAQLRARRRAAQTGVGEGEDGGGPGDGAAEATEEETDAAAVAEGEEGWREELIRILLDLTPDAFERLTLRLLREAGFTNTEVTGRPGDGGIDGQGVYRLSLVSFPVFFQCKRYRGSVGAGAVRDFRGAMAGRGDNGLLITTGTFTADAKREATRAGAPPIDLIDGDRLCELLKEYGIGVSTRAIEQIAVSTEFFGEV